MSDHLTDAQYAAFIDRLIACRQAEDDAKEDTKLVYAELAEAGEDKTAAGLIVRGLRMSAKDRAKANLRDAAVEKGMDRYNRGKASHVRVREASIPEHDADGVIIEPTGAMVAADANIGGKHETAVRSDPSVNIPGRRHLSESGAHDGHAVETGELQRQPLTATHNEPAEGSAEETSAPIRRMSMTPREPREAGGLKGFGFTVRFDEPETIPSAADPTVVVSEAGGGDSAPSLAAIPVADHSKPNPICRDPGECGVYASWEMPCQACVKAAAAHRVAA